MINSQRILDIVEKQNKWRRKQCLNLIASESVMSPLAEQVFSSDFTGRYNEHDTTTRHYEGTELSYEIEEICNDLFRKKFSTKFVDSRPISGAIANLIVFKAFTKPRDTIAILGIPNGSHVSHTKWGVAGVLGLKNVKMAFNHKEMNIDIEKTVEIIKKHNPNLVIFGGSLFLFPEPIKEIKDQISPEIKIIYDSAHVFGLVYNKFFQEPFKEGVDVITTSTHKTFQGPQGGLIIGSNNLVEEDWLKIENTIFPRVLSNTQIYRFPSLAITALEMNEFGQEYGKQIVKNAKALGRALFEKKFNVLCEYKGFTESHQLVIDVNHFGGGDYVAKKLASCNIICNKMPLPEDTPHAATKNPSGIRLGVQELTRYGLKETEMYIIAELFKKVIIDKESSKTVKSKIEKLKQMFKMICYCFDKN